MTKSAAPEKQNADRPNLLLRKSGAGQVPPSSLIERLTLPSLNLVLQVVRKTSQRILPAVPEVLELNPNWLSGRKRKLAKVATKARWHKGKLAHVGTKASWLKWHKCKLAQVGTKAIWLKWPQRQVGSSGHKGKFVKVVIKATWLKWA
jgi:hypothetical protein